jgi:hypothetical protein
MLSLLKKNAGKGDGPVAAGWHPNFRNFAQLPDTKVVRTSFFVNGVAIFAALAVILFFAYQEYTLSVLSTQIQEWEQKIETQKKGSQDAVALFRKFQEEQAFASDVDAFLQSEGILYSDFVAHLGASLPKHVALMLIEYNAGGVNLKGVVQAEPDSATGIASSYEKQLKDDPVIAKAFPAVDLTTLVRDPQNGQLVFQIALRSQDGGKKK